MSAEHTIGFGNSSRASSRVLKPPVSNFQWKFSPKRKACKKKSIKKEREKRKSCDDLISLVVVVARH